jgi:diguanylate cyclase (GGDEF)-like protein
MLRAPQEKIRDSIPTMKTNTEINSLAWIYTLKRKMLVGLLGFLTISIAVAMVLIAVLVRHSLYDDSASKSQELGDTIQANLRTLMLKRDPDAIQDTIDRIGINKDSIVSAFILDKAGRIVYSSNRAEIGAVLNRFTEESCHGCHRNIGAAPSEHTLIIRTNGMDVQRNVKVIFNEPACRKCHAPSDRINGKLIIDRSLKRTEQLISSIELIIFGSGGACLLFAVPFLRRKIGSYINEILNKNREVELLVSIARRLSNTIDVKELRNVVAGVVGDTFDADEVDIVHPRDKSTYRVYTWDRTAQELSRRVVEESSELHSTIRAWIAGALIEKTMSADGKQGYLPVNKGTVGLALIGIRRKDGPFDPERLKFIDPVCSHMAMAFENAYLYSIAISDELTHLYSLRHFRFCIEREVLSFERDGQTFTLLLIDADNFKKINDAHGHIVGDTVLQETARCIAASTRDNDLAFRYGGEEFAVLLPATDMDGSRPVAERIRAAVEAHVVETEGLRLHLTISIGISSCPKTADSSKELLMAADKALYKAKETGKNRIVISGGD